MYMLVETTRSDELGVWFYLLDQFDGQQFDCEGYWLEFCVGVRGVFCFYILSVKMKAEGMLQSHYVVK